MGLWLTKLLQLGCIKKPDLITVMSIIISSICSHLVMISRASLGRNAQAALRCQCLVKPNNRRSFAAQVSPSFSYEIGDASGIKFASRDLPGPTTYLAVVAKAGTRYQPFPGFSDGLEQFAFKVSSVLTQLGDFKSYSRRSFPTRVSF